RHKLRKLEFKAPVLGLECTSFFGSVALLDEDGVLALDALRSPTMHSCRILPAIERLLEALGLPPAELAGICVSRGPGSFTGVRIGLSIAKGLSHGANVPLVGVSTLEALAYRYYQRGADVCPLIDARRNEVYAALFSVERSGQTLKRKLADRVGPLAAILERIKRRTVFVGDGVVRYREEIAAALGERARFAPPARLLPSAEEVAQLGRRRLLAGDVDDPAALGPLYLRRADAKPPRLPG
ncbi:tRNA (adenosine(37)-N6)-threonylcarbamoyltransferase complex dimerization subunit type 1 TsaB, partial [Candidatus Sumerlaeota bacterium]